METKGNKFDPLFEKNIPVDRDLGLMFRAHTFNLAKSIYIQTKQTF